MASANRIDSSGLSRVWSRMKTYIKNYTEPFNIDKVYPVGAIYMSVSSTNPGNLFGGTWERIQNQFLLSAGGDYPAGTTGGSADAVVVSHSHTQASHTHHNAKGAGWGYLSYNTSKSTMTRSKVNTSSGSRYTFLGTPNATSADGSNMDWGGQLQSTTPSINSSGVSGTGKNMPPYLSVYVWKRTA